MKERRRLEDRVENRLQALEVLRGTADVILTDLTPSEVVALRQKLKVRSFFPDKEIQSFCCGM